MKEKRKFVLFAGIHEENETRWDEAEQEWVSVVDKRGKPVFRKYQASIHPEDPPAIVESHLDLVRLFANKFREILPEPERIAGPQGPPPATTSDGRPPAAEPAKAAAPNLGREVTETFKGAVDANVKVYEDKGKFVIAEANGDLYDNGIRLTRKEVEKLLSDLVPA